jgi:transposase InsO family protein
VTDNDPSFMAGCFEDLCRRLGIHKMRTTVYHPQGNAPIETFHRQLKKGLTIFSLTQRSLEDIDEAIQLCCMAYRTQLHLALNDSPAFRLFGIDLGLPSESEWRFGLDRVGRDRIRFLNLHRIDLQLRANSLEATKLQDGSKKEFKLGDLALVRLQPHERTALAHKDGIRKLVPKWSLPYRVVRVLRAGQTATLKPL